VGSCAPNRRHQALAAVLDRGKRCGEQALVRLVVGREESLHSFVGGAGLTLRLSRELLLEGSVFAATSVFSVSATLTSSSRPSRSSASS
jgi:hypothetical protein